MKKKLAVSSLLIMIGVFVGPGGPFAEEPVLAGPDGSGEPGGLGQVEVIEEQGGGRLKFRNDDCGLDFQCSENGFQPQGNFFGTCSASQRNALANVASHICQNQ
ncbi:MAG: hypothetical protein AAF560_00730 [Acidobacteriota bacterium]